jgi:hypothetical protein
MALFAHNLYYTIEEDITLNLPLINKKEAKTICRRWEKVEK